MHILCKPVLDVNEAKFHQFSKTLFPRPHRSLTSESSIRIQAGRCSIKQSKQKHFPHTRRWYGDVVVTWCGW